MKRPAATREVQKVTRLPDGNRRHDRLRAALNLPLAGTAAGCTPRCPVRDLLDCLGDRWSVLTLVALTQGTQRFTQLRHTIGDISQRMLAQTLRTLERDGYVHRTVYPTIPPKVEYTLTPLGRSLMKRVKPLIAWAEQNQSSVLAARRAFVPPPPIAAL